MTKSVVSVSASETLLHMKLTLYIFQSTAVSWDCSMKNFVKLTGKHFGQSLFLINLQAVPEPFSNLFQIIMMYVECVTEGFFFLEEGEWGRGRERGTNSQFSAHCNENSGKNIVLSQNQ